MRAPLRQGLDWLRDRLAEVYESRMSNYVQDPWQLRNKFIDLLNDRTDKNTEQFISDAVRQGIEFR